MKNHISIIIFSFYSLIFSTSGLAGLEDQLKSEEEIKVQKRVAEYEQYRSAGRIYAGVVFGGDFKNNHLKEDNNVAEFVFAGMEGTAIHITGHDEEGINGIKVEGKCDKAQYDQIFKTMKSKYKLLKSTSQSASSKEIMKQVKSGEKSVLQLSAFEGSILENHAEIYEKTTTNFITPYGDIAAVAFTLIQIDRRIARGLGGDGKASTSCDITYVSKNITADLKKKEVDAKEKQRNADQAEAVKKNKDKAETNKF